MFACTGIYPLKFITIRGILESLVFLQGQERCSKQISQPHTGCFARCITVYTGCARDVLFGVCASLDENLPCHPKAHVFEYLVSNW